MHSSTKDSASFSFKGLPSGRALKAPAANNVSRCMSFAFSMDAFLKIQAGSGQQPGPAWTSHFRLAVYQAPAGLELDSNGSCLAASPKRASAMPAMLPKLKPPSQYENHLMKNASLLRYIVQSVSV